MVEGGGGGEEGEVGEDGGGEAERYGIYPMIKVREQHNDQS